MILFKNYEVEIVAYLYYLKTQLYTHIQLGKTLQETLGFGLGSWNMFLQPARYLLKAFGNSFPKDTNFSLCSFPLGRLGMLIFCSSWATWRKTTWPLLRSGVKEAACTNTCTCKRPSSRCFSSSILPGRQHRAWSEWRKQCWLLLSLEQRSPSLPQTPALKEEHVRTAHAEQILCRLNSKLSSRIVFLWILPFVCVRPPVPWQPALLYLIFCSLRSYCSAPDETVF